jgi:phage tail-like protein
MTDGSDRGNPWPLQFRFSVDIEGVAANLAFLEVTGLDTEAQIIDYRPGNSKAFPTARLPGIVKSGNVTLKKGVCPNDEKMWEWFEQTNLNPIARRAITIRLLDEDANPTMVWTLTNAWPVRFTGTDLKSDSKEVGVESIEIAHQGVAIANR